ncbi:MAG: hypothetical protein ACM3ZE_11150 [Myxococcales bacterium]
MPIGTESWMVCPSRPRRMAIRRRWNTRAPASHRRGSWFVLCTAAEAGPILVKPRDTSTMMRGPLTRKELRQVLEWRESKPSAVVVHEGDEKRSEGTGSVG